MNEAILYSANDHYIFINASYEVAELTRQSHEDLIITSTGLVEGTMLPDHYYKLHDNYIVGFVGSVYECKKNKLQDTITFKSKLITQVVSYFDLKIHTCFSLIENMQSLIDTERRELTKLKFEVLTMLIQELRSRVYIDRSQYDALYAKYSSILLGA